MPDSKVRMTNNLIREFHIYDAIFSDNLVLFACLRYSSQLLLDRTAIYPPGSCNSNLGSRTHKSVRMLVQFLYYMASLNQGGKSVINKVEVATRIL